MKTLAIQNDKAYNQNLSRIYLEKHNQIPDLYIDQSFYNAQTKQTILCVYSSMFRNDNLNLMIKGDHLCILLSEHIEFTNSYHSHQQNLTIQNQQSYDRFCSVNVMLGDSSYMVLHQDFGDAGVLKITLGQSFAN